MLFMSVSVKLIHLVWVNPRRDGHPRSGPTHTPSPLNSRVVGRQVTISGGRWRRRIAVGGRSVDDDGPGGRVGPGRLVVSVVVGKAARRAGGRPEGVGLVGRGHPLSGLVVGGEASVGLVLLGRRLLHLAKDFLEASERQE